jgi:hypothetical protein
MIPFNRGMCHMPRTSYFCTVQADTFDKYEQEVRAWDL